MPLNHPLLSNSFPVIADTPIAVAVEQFLMAEHWKTWMSSALYQAAQWFGPILLGLLTLGLAFFLARHLARRLSNVLCRRVDETLGKFMAKIAFYAVFVLAAVIVLQAFGVPLSGIVAIMASTAFAVALALQGTLSNIASGVLLLIFRPFKVGDLVQIAGVTGKINEIDLFTTSLDTFDNRRMILPNASIASSTIENINFHAERRIDITIGVDYEASLDRTRSALTAAAESIEDQVVAGETRGYQVVLSSFSESSVEWTVRIWVQSENFFQARERLLVEIKRFLDRAEIGIPYPQLRVHMDSSRPSMDSEPVKPGLGDLASSNGGANKARTVVEGSVSPIRPRVRDRANRECGTELTASAGQSSQGWCTQ
jgi:small conductance mechanosensitive channel